MSIFKLIKILLFKIGLKKVLRFDGKEIEKLFIPLSGIEKLSTGFKSTNLDPQFKINNLLTTILSKGTYLIKLRINYSTYGDIAKFYIDYGDGFKEEYTFSERVNNPSINFLVYFNKKPTALRFDPCENKDVFFEIKTLVVKKITTKEEYEIISNLKSEIHNLKLEIFRLQKNISQIPIPVVNPASPYANWIRKYEIPEFSNIWKILNEIQTFELKPKISIIMPVYNTPEKFLREAIESVVSQSYPNWELCIADDFSSEPHVKEVIEKYKKLLPDKIKVVYREKNGNICEASNSALVLATGEYIGFLDHDDTLSPHALYYVVKEINKNPSVKIIYSDEDKIDTNGLRFDPHFKSDWNLDLLLSYNYINHFLVIKKEIIDKIGGFRKGLEGAQDYDLVLRASLYVKDHEVSHIPKILYHWRAWEGSTAMSPETKPITQLASKRALEDYLKAKKIVGAKVEYGRIPNSYRIIYPIPDPPPVVSIIIPTKDEVKFLRNCIESIIKKTTYKNYEIIIINNNSQQSETVKYFSEIQQKINNIKVIDYNNEFNYAAINNFAVKHAKGELILLLNNDTEVLNSEWLTEIVSHAVRPEIGCVGAKLYYPNGSIQHGGVIIGLGGVAGHSHKHFPLNHPGYMGRLQIVQNLSAVTGACLMVKKKIYEDVGGLDEENLKIAFNDVDFCLKVREAGYKNLWTPYAELIHYESKTRGYDDTPEKIERFKKEIEFMKKKWKNKLLIDPYYNPNLTLDREDFSIKD
jgi:GT2 family glycosyltransferase